VQRWRPATERRSLAETFGAIAGLEGDDEHHITKTYIFPDFKTALDFVNRVGAVAESEGHHPDIALAWGRVDVKTYTHKIDGLTESDFVLAAKVDQEFFNRPKA